MFISPKQILLLAPVPYYRVVVAVVVVLCSSARMNQSYYHHSSSIIILVSYLTLLMISIINIPTCLCEDNTQYTNCSHAFNCESKIRNLKYPFWGGNRKQYCGSVAADPNTELTCEQSVPKITINFAKYRILDWDNTTQKLTVARDDYSRGDVCAVNNNYKNSSFDNTLFQRYNGDVDAVIQL
jgi:hypothetical protein